MHPEILKALAEARRADLLRRRHYEYRDEFREPDVAPRGGGLRRLRHIIGAALIGAGNRLLGDGTPGLEALDGQP